MSSIVLSSAVRQNLLALQNTASMMATTQNNLATGKKVNSALDNPTNFFTASGLDNRAGDISNLLDGISNGVQVLQAANTGITSLQSLVSQAQSIANQALQSPIGYSTKSNISTTIAGATSSNLLGTPSYTNNTFTGAVVNNHAATPAPITTTTALSGTGTGNYISGLTGGTDDLVVNGSTISFASSGATTVSSTGATINISTGTIADVVSAINTITGSTTASISAGSLVLATGTTASGITVGGTTAALTALGLNSGGTDTNTTSTGGVTGLTAAGTKLVGATTTPLGGQILQIASTGGGIPTNLTFGTGPNQISTLNQLNTALAGNNLQATLTSAGVLTISTTNDFASQTIGTVSGSIVGGAFPTGTAGAAPVPDANSQATRATLVSQYNAILTQISNTASDSSYNGINLLAGDQLQLTFNETGKSKVDITGVDFSAAGLGLSNLVQGTAFIDNASTNNVLSTLQTVSSTLRAQASAFGSNLSVVQTRQDFNKNLINVLQTGSANLTQADINEEAANSQALSTRQSLSVSALSLANQAQQSVLQLLR